MILSGSEIVIECLKEQGVDTVFGYPGGTILNIYDELYKHSHEIRHILTSHEQGAAHAADGYARATGKVGVCMATSGPGATNLVTGIATAYMDSVPLVAFTCNVGVNLLGRDSFQEVDITGITMPITKYSCLVKDVKNLAPTIRRAFRIAKSGRPGPVLVDITKDVTAAKCDYTPVVPEEIPRKIESIRYKDLEEAAALIAKAKRPMIFVGGGAVASGAAEQVRELARRIDAPVADTLMGKGVFPGTDPLYMGMLGMHGTKTANNAAANCDLLIALGCRFSDRDTGNTKAFAHQAKIIHMDIDEAEIDKNVICDCSVVGDLKESLIRLLQKVQPAKHEEWIKRMETYRSEHPLKYDHSVVTGPYVIEELYKLTKGDAIITTDVGQHQMWTAQYYKYKEPRQLLTSGGLGTMGYGLGAAMGAKAAFPDRTVVNIGGDGCFRMNLVEVISAVRNKINVIEIVMNNEVLGMVRQWQHLFYGERYSNTILDDGIDYVKIAEGMGALGLRITKLEDVDEVLKTAINAGRPVVIDCQIGKDDMVFPMAPAGKAIEKAFDQDDIKL
ncbi:MAG: biosynthetic-type acetolactate synthase large subunit [Eubacteriales bacterium]|jgi:acetolactate synthase-1/2/3 large subunit|nr:biosynthetic-type acetolactate synthase large subunit [Lachnospiraceae bacterium]MDD5859131.1 biosynthetic-type acetolactate synthase large subunit [Eubacteriales bacterium]MCH4064678.1 biosynthetic-type acetolactate synthase large subunit [Lachnospiraceae bacterium]MCH4104910.1 biosynthetic-type acetolactate synthase large subunit [Lachnospiraceae bacterium]MCI1308362.1 biosynthetic-type acetolactate synthase large subunit [Lachnospiraceae bacterium]